MVWLKEKKNEIQTDERNDSKAQSQFVCGRTRQKQVVSLEGTFLSALSFLLQQEQEHRGLYNAVCK